MILRRSPRIESRNEEKKIWIPTMISVAASTASRSSASAPKPLSIQSTTMNAPIAIPATAITPPSSNPCSSLNRARIWSNHRSCSFMKYVP